MVGTAAVSRIAVVFWSNAIGPKSFKTASFTLIIIAKLWWTCAPLFPSYFGGYRLNDSLFVPSDRISKSCRRPSIQIASDDAAIIHCGIFDSFVNILVSVDALLLLAEFCHWSFTGSRLIRFGDRVVIIENRGHIIDRILLPCCEISVMNDWCSLGFWIWIGRIFVVLSHEELCVAVWLVDCVWLVDLPLLCCNSCEGLILLITCGQLFIHSPLLNGIWNSLLYFIRWSMTIIAKEWRRFKLFRTTSTLSYGCTTFISLTTIITA